MNILVTGGTGYIGSHTVIELIENGHSVVIVDDLSNSNKEVLTRLKEITGVDVKFHEIDLCDKSTLENVFSSSAIDAVIHFAGLKSVGESVSNPLKYYRTNIDSTLSLLEVMADHNVSNIIFSSSATVYGTPQSLPLTEDSQTGIGITNPYGWTKYMIEQIITDACAADSSLQATLLRYFNPVGAHSSGRIGEDPNGIPNNLLPFVSQVAVGRREKVMVFGNDYPTIDGTGVRDYIHVVDLAKGHVAALEHAQSGVSVYNLGAGKGTSVLELIHAFEQASGKTIAYEITNRRDGDIAACYADPTKAKTELSWSAEKSIQEACEDSWRWQSQNPDGFK